MTFLPGTLRSLRHLIRRPLYPTIAVGILSLGLAAAITTFAYINSFSQSLPGVDPEGLVEVFGTTDDDPFTRVSFLDFQDYAEASAGFENLAAVQHNYLASVRHEEMTELAFLEAVTGAYFDVLRVRPAVGRLLTMEDDRLESPQAAVISYAWWRSRFQSDPGVLGKALYLNYRPFTIVGVAAQEFVGSAADFRPHAWIPIAHFRDRYTGWHTLAQNRDVPLVKVFGRLGPSTRPEQALQGLKAIAHNLDQGYPRLDEIRNLRMQPATWIDPQVRVDESSTNRILVLASIGFLLLVCANVANLLLAVSSARQKTYALQAALGATPGRIVRDVLGQNVLLSSIAGLIALGLAVPLSGRLGSFFERPSVWGGHVPRELTLDGGVVAFAVLAAVITGAIASVLPALDVLRRGAADVLKSDLAGGASPGSVLGIRIPGTRDLLISAQVSLAAVLLVVSGLVLKTLSAASRVDPGFAYGQLVGSHVSTSSTDLLPEEREQFFRELEARIAEEPWVRSATVSGYAPLSAHPSVRLGPEGEGGEVETLLDRVHDGFFAKVGIDVVDGRPFAASDTMGGMQVAVLNRAAAERLYPGQSPVGRRIAFAQADGSDASVEVVGMVGDVKVRDFLAPVEPAVFFPYAQAGAYPTGSALLISAKVPPEQAVALLQRWLRAFEPHLAIVNSISYQDVVSGQLYSQRMNAELFTALAGLGLALACAGIFSVVSLSVTRRRREIGIRKAIGSTSGAINSLIVRQTMGPVVAGGVIGLVLATAGSGLVASLLYEVEPSDPTVLVGGVGALLLAGGLAAYGPAFRASRADPVTALRAD